MCGLGRVNRERVVLRDSAFHDWLLGGFVKGRLGAGGGRYKVAVFTEQVFSEDNAKRHRVVVVGIGGIFNKGLLPRFPAIFYLPHGKVEAVDVAVVTKHNIGNEDFLCSRPNQLPIEVLGMKHDSMKVLYLAKNPMKKGMVVDRLPQGVKLFWR